MTDSADTFVAWLDGAGAVYWLGQVLVAVVFSGVCFDWLRRAAARAGSLR